MLNPKEIHQYLNETTQALTKEEGLGAFPPPLVSAYLNGSREEIDESQMGKITRDNLGKIYPHIHEAYDQCPNWLPQVVENLVVQTEFGKTSLIAKLAAHTLQESHHQRLAQLYPIEVAEKVAEERSAYDCCLPEIQAPMIAFLLVTDTNTEDVKSVLINATYNKTLQAAIKDWENQILRLKPVKGTDPSNLHDNERRQKELRLIYELIPDGHFGHKVLDKMLA